MDIWPEVAVQALTLIESGLSQRNLRTELHINRSTFHRVYHWFLELCSLFTWNTISGNNSTTDYGYDQYEK